MSWQSGSISMEHRFEFPGRPVDLRTAVGPPLALLPSPSPPGLPCGSSVNTCLSILTNRQRPMTTTQRGVYLRAQNDIQGQSQLNNTKALECQGLQLPIYLTAIDRFD